MDNKNPPKADQPMADKIFFAVFFTLIAAVVIITYAKYFVAKDYYIQAEADCDPAAQACFVTTCDPATDSECSVDPAEQTSYTKIVKKKANQIPLCDPNDENCQALQCLPGEDCQETLCDEKTVEEGQGCNDPEVYLEENPPSAEDEEGLEEECAPDDEECLNSEEDTESEDSENDIDTEENSGGEDNDSGAEILQNVAV